METCRLLSDTSTQSLWLPWQSGYMGELNRHRCLLPSSRSEHSLIDMSAGPKRDAERGKKSRRLRITFVLGRNKRFSFPSDMTWAHDPKKRMKTTAVCVSCVFTELYFLSGPDHIVLQRRWASPHLVPTTPGNISALWCQMSQLKAAINICVKCPDEDGHDRGTLVGGWDNKEIQTHRQHLTDPSCRRDLLTALKQSKTWGERTLGCADLFMWEAEKGRRCNQMLICRLFCKRIKIKCVESKTFVCVQD